MGYYAAWTANARNSPLANINLSGGGGSNMTLYCTMTSALVPNSSPVFVNDAVANVCANDTTYILNNAVDPDGDQLVYSFGTPYGGTSLTLPATWPIPPVTIPFVTGYDVVNPLGRAANFPGNYANVNATTGISKYRTAANLGTLYVVAVDVSEFRTINGRRVLIENDD
ncbi:MAG: hypothetical protein EOO62_29530 [Hymenobacter sp.]|nr:MAG: hypothetical protein EOO62_29530 [Hymenobacter sp.]